MKAIAAGRSFYVCWHIYGQMGATETHDTQCDLGRTGSDEPVCSPDHVQMGQVRNISAHLPHAIQRIPVSQAKTTKPARRRIQ